MSTVQAGALDSSAQPISDVPFVALDRQHGTLRDELRGAFERVLGASAFILGHEVEQFEQEFATYCGTTECIGVGSGTAALTLALMAARVGRGDEVIVPAHTFIATALAVVHAGAKPIFCDVEERTGLIDVTSAAARVTPRTAAIIPVHLYGQVADMDAVKALAARHGLLVLEDAAQAHGATYKGQRAGSLGVAAGFSFYPSKNLGALGDGGAICTNDVEIAQRARRLRHLGQLGKGDHLYAGFNERLDGLQAALLRVKLPHLDSWNRGRRSVAWIYESALGGEVEVLEERLDRRCVYHLFPIRVRARDQVIAMLTAQGIGCGIHYSPAVHQQPPFADEWSAADGLEQADRWAREELSLPIYPELTPEEAVGIARLALEAHAVKSRDPGALPRLEAINTRSRSRP